MLDERGNAALEPVPRHEGWLTRSVSVFAGGAGVFASGVAIAFFTPAAGVACLVAGSAAMLGGFVLSFVPKEGSDLKRRRARARRLAAEAGEPRRISDVRSGLVRVQGKVEALEASSFVAFESSPDDRHCWRFAIRDGSGVGIVDDDCFEIWKKSLGKCGGTVAEGAQIEVIGRACRQPVSDPRLVAAYRDPTVVRFEGTPDVPLLILIP